MNSVFVSSSAVTVYHGDTSEIGHKYITAKTDGTLFWSVKNIFVSDVMFVICSRDDCFPCFGFILLSLVYFWRCGQIGSGLVSSGLGQLCGVNRTSQRLQR